MFTSFSLVCRQGKEKVKPTGSFLSLMSCFSMKFPRHSATWSNSWRRGAEGQGEGKLRSCSWTLKLTHSCPAAVQDFVRRVVDLTLHLNGLLIPVAHFDTEDPERTASQIQSDEIPFLCRFRDDGKRRRRDYIAGKKVRFCKKVFSG